MGNRIKEDFVLLILGRKKNQTFWIDEVEVIVLGVKGRNIGFGVRAAKHVNVVRGELLSKAERQRRRQKQSPALAKPAEAIQPQPPLEKLAS